MPYVTRGLGFLPDPKATDPFHEQLIGGGFLSAASTYMLGAQAVDCARQGGGACVKELGSRVANLPGAIAQLPMGGIVGFLIPPALLIWGASMLFGGKRGRR